MSEHSYEEIRVAFLKLLQGEEKVSSPIDQFKGMGNAIATVLNRWDNVRPQNGYCVGSYEHLSSEDSNTYGEVFWDLFRSGIITLGINDSNPNFPFFRMTSWAERILNDSNLYFFHDVSEYEKILLKEIPSINQTTLLYLKEAMQAFAVGCYLSSSVMLGVATEYEFDLLMENITQGSHHAKYVPVNQQKTILQRLTKFKNILEQNIRDIPAELREDIDTHFSGIISIIRTFRNQAGHPTGKIMTREQMYVLLQIFIPYARKIYALKEFFKN